MADAQRSLALLAMRKGAMATLDQAATQLINLQPTVPEGYALRTVSETNRGQFSAAEEEVHKAIAVGPQSQLEFLLAAWRSLPVQAGLAQRPGLISEGIGA